MASSTHDVCEPVTDLGAALLLGLVCGLLARIGDWAITLAKQLPLARAGLVGYAVAGLSIAALVSN